MLTYTLFQYVIISKFCNLFFTGIKKFKGERYSGTQKLFSPGFIVSFALQITIKEPFARVISKYKRF